MNNEIREQVLGIVAGMRGEKRASVNENLHEQAGGSSGMANDTREAILDVVSGMRAQKSAAAQPAPAPAVQGASVQAAQPVARQAARPAAAAVQAAGSVTGAAGQEAAEAMRGHESSDMMTELVLRMVARSRGRAQRAAQRRAGVVGAAGVTGAAAARTPVQGAARAPAAVPQTAVPAAPAAAGAQAAAPAIPKAAEAYFAGFCKAAEDMGVDPVWLYKQAQIKQRIANGLGRVGGFFKRIFGFGQQSGQKALSSYAARARSGVAPTMEEARGTMDKVLGEYFGGKVPPGLRESILGPFGKTAAAHDAYESGFCKAAEAIGVSPDELMKIAVQARILPPGSPDEPIFHTREALMETRSPRIGYSYGMSRDGMARAFDSHGNIRLTPEAAKELNISLDRLKSGSGITLPRALSTPGSHHSSAALHARLPSRLERQLYGAEVRDAVYKYWRGGKTDRLFRLASSGSPKVSQMAKRLLGVIGKLK